MFLPLWEVFAWAMHLMGLFFVYYLALETGKKFGLLK